MLWQCWLDIRKSTWPVKIEWWCAYLFGARCRLFAYGPSDATASQNLTISCIIQTDLTFLVPAYPSCPGKEAVKWLLLSVFSCTVLFVTISQVIGCEDHLRNDLYCVELGVKLYSTNNNQLQVCLAHGVIVLVRDDFSSLRQELSLWYMVGFCLEWINHIIHLSFNQFINYFLVFNCLMV